ncbi:MAG: MarR family winged helix-turn-helix transcriptional regulator [Alistipes sp.]|nr:MarR family winged helix-turn-helix transcriptional regulator [Alistipes sp.]
MAKNNIVTPDDQLGYLLVQTSFLNQRQTNAMLRPLGLTYMQFVVLAGIYELNTQFDSVSQRMLVSARRLDKAMASGIVKKLAGRGLICREPNPADSRSWLLTLTAEGQRLAAQARKKVHMFNEDFFTGIDQPALRAMFKKLIEKEI